MLAGKMPFKIDGEGPTAREIDSLFKEEVLLCHEIPDVKEAKVTFENCNLLKLHKEVFASESYICHLRSHFLRRGLVEEEGDNILKD